MPGEAIEEKYNKTVDGTMQVQKRKLAKSTPVTQKQFSTSSVMSFCNMLYVIISLKHQEILFF